MVCIAARLHERQLNQQLARYGLSFSALDAMEVIAERQPATATDVAATLCVTRQSLGKVLRRLQSLGFLTKEPGRDARTAILRLTPAGRGVLSAAEHLIGEQTPTDTADGREFRRQLEIHVRHLRNTERGGGGY
uniref:MarR family winged helix-turn-helix transcriptional regulator n=1 Tax=Pseudarthrobacter oxydans TaxID=1671 RepID=UPI003F49897B